MPPAPRPASSGSSLPPRRRCPIRRSDSGVVPEGLISRVQPVGRPDRRLDLLTDWVVVVPRLMVDELVAHARRAVVLRDLERVRRAADVLALSLVGPS